MVPGLNHNSELAKNKQSSLLGPFICYQKNYVLLIWYLV